MELITGENDKDRRLDRILRKALPDYPLPLIHKLLRQKKVLVDGKPGKAEDRVDSGARIIIKPQRTQSIATEKSPEEEKTILSTSPSVYSVNSVVNSFNLKDRILWESADLIAVNKPVGISVHGKDSLDDMVRAYLANKLTPSLSFKPGPLHRLDKPSSGIVVFSKSLEGARLFTSLMREHKIRKTYLAVVAGEIKKEEIWQDNLIRDKEKKKTFVAKINDSGKNAVTKVTPLSFKDGFTIIKAEIETGRTHQIRAQAAAHGHPLAGDVKYHSKLEIRNNKLEMGNKVDIFLHAWKLEFLDVRIEAPVPEGFPNP